MATKKKPTFKSRVKKSPPKKQATPKKPKASRKKPSIPQGFKRVPRALPKNAATMQRVAAEQQRHALLGAARMLDKEGNFSTAVHVHQNRDGTVDGELRAFNIKRGYKINDVLTDISVALYGTPHEPSEFRLPEGHWISVGGLTDWGGSKEDWQAAYDRAKSRGATDSEARQIASAASSPLPRYRGLDRVALYPQRSVELPAQIFRAQQGLLGEAHRDQVGRKRGRKHKTKPIEVLVRVYWNPWGVTPANIGGRGGTKRRRRSSN